MRYYLTLITTASGVETYGPSAQMHLSTLFFNQCQHGKPVTARRHLSQAAWVNNTHSALTLSSRYHKKINDSNLTLHISMALGFFSRILPTAVNPSTDEKANETHCQLSVSCLRTIKHSIFTQSINNYDPLFCCIQ